MVADKPNIFLEASDATPCTYIYLPDLSCEPPRANFHYVVLPPFGGSGLSVSSSYQFG
jgi:hypothetical protein